MAISERLFNGINLLQNGDSAGFDIIYGETASYVYGRARMIMKDEQDTNDLVQETFIQAYQHITALQDPQNIFAWLGAITYRQGMKIYRKKNEVLLDEEGEGIFEQIESNDTSWNPELSAEQKAVGNIIAEIIDELPPLQKAALTAFYYDGLKIDQIAEMYECSSNTIKSRLNYAKKYLREKVEAREKQDGVRLHSVGGISIIMLGLHQLLATPKYTITQAVYGQIYTALFQTLGLGVAGSAAGGAATAAISGSASGGVLSGSAASSGAIQASTFAGATHTAAAAATAKAGAASLVTKIAIISGSIVAGTVAAGAIGFAIYNFNSPKDELPKPDPIINEISTETQTPDIPVNIVEPDTAVVETEEPANTETEIPVEVVEPDTTVVETEEPVKEEPKKQETKKKETPKKETKKQETKKKETPKKETPKKETKKKETNKKETKKKDSDNGFSLDNPSVDVNQN